MPIIRNGSLEGSRTGDIKEFGGTIIASGWLLCDGSNASKTTYPDLWNILGTTWGSDGGDNFVLPDMRGRTTIGDGTGTTVDATAHTLGQTKGSEKHVLLIAEMAPHTHGMPTSTIQGTKQRNTEGNSPTTTTDQVTPAGSNSPHNNLGPIGIVKMIIRAS